MFSHATELRGRKGKDVAKFNVGRLCLQLCPLPLPLRQIALNDIAVSVENVQKLTRELQVGRWSVCP